MRTKTSFFYYIITALIFVVATDDASAQNTVPQTLTWTINGETRMAIAYLPPMAKSKPTAVIFAFHGHGGNMLNMYRTRGFDKLWPEAIFICPQGLATPGMLSDPQGKKSGWLMKDTSSLNRDLAFFDAMLKTLRTNYNIDNSKIYATGHSNGGGFTYLLWATRAKEFAAFAPTATAAGKLSDQLSPKPGLHLIGEADPLVKPIMQRLTYNTLLKVNGCANIGLKIDSNVTLYNGKNGNDIVIFSHAGGHEYPKKANPVIIDFFKKYSKK